VSWGSVVDTALGLAFVFLVASLAVSKINEFVATVLQWRPKGLDRGLAALVGENGAGTLSTARIKSTAAVQAFERAVGARRSISYLSAPAFASALAEILTGSQQARERVLPTTDAVRDALDAIHPEYLDVAAPEARQALSSGVTVQKVDALAKRVPLADEVNLAAVARLQEALAAADVVASRIRAGIDQLEQEGNPAAPALRAFFNEAGGQVDDFLQRVQQWYVDTMGRLSGWYKRRVQVAIAIYGVVVVVLFNLDAAGVAENLWLSPVQRASVASVAAQHANGNVTDVRVSLSQLKDLSLPIGWDFSPNPPQDGGVERRIPGSAGLWVRKIVGLAISVLAISLGAPFWFDTLGRIARLRNAGDKPADAAPTK
jgi:hypothetical protein